MTDETMTTVSKVTVVSNGNPFYLRNTVWTSDPDRATEFKSWAEALAGLRKAEKFMKSSIYKKARIMQFNKSTKTLG